MRYIMSCQNINGHRLTDYGMIKIRYSTKAYAVETLFRTSKKDWNIGASSPVKDIQMCNSMVEEWRRQFDVATVIGAYYTYDDKPISSPGSGML